MPSFKSYADLQKADRQLILLASMDDDGLLLSQKKAFAAQDAENKERQLILIEETSNQGPLHKKYRIKSGFAAILVGKDGGEKWRSLKDFPMSDLYKRIDAMPMRRSNPN